jgi:hypothetical protein
MSSRFFRDTEDNSTLTAIRRSAYSKSIPLAGFLSSTIRKNKIPGHLGLQQMSAAAPNGQEQV